MVITTEFKDKWVCPVTSEDGQKDYYYKFLHWRVGYANNNPVIPPTREEAIEYKQILAEQKNLKPWSKGEERKKYKKLELYNTKYDWRPQITASDTGKGLISPDGSRILPDLFRDIFTQFDAINSKPLFLPVFNGKGWSLIALTEPLIMATGLYKTILPERWDRYIFFVQDMNTEKWGALSISHIRGNSHNWKSVKTFPAIKTLMPCIADEILEDELMTDCSPTTFWVTRIGDKIGILTPWGYSDIIYDDYTTNADKLTFRMLRNDRKRAKILSYHF